MEELELKKFDMRRVKPTNVCAFLAQRNSGKCLAKGTGVMMFEETTKKVEDIKVGDLVMGDDQTPRTVLGVNNGVDEMYEITNEYGTSYTVNSQHILSLVYSRQKTLKKFDYSYKISWFKKETLKYVTRTFIFNKENRENVFVKALVFYRNIVDDLKVDMDIQKYLSLKKNHRKYFYGYQQSLNFSEKRVLTEDYEDLVIRIFRDLDGEIPHCYKYNSKEIRCHLLMAIVAYTGANLNSCMKVYHKNLDDTIFITRSLGLQVKIVSDEEIHIKSESLEAKITVKPKGQGEYYGFELDGNHKFYLENCVITHNSFLIRDLLYYQQSLPAGLVVSKTDKLTHYYEQFIPPVLIHDEYSPELIDKLFDRQKKAIEEDWSNPHVFLIFDDTLSDAGTWKKDPRIKEIFFNGRHYKILFLLTMQSPMAITPDLRGNIDFTFILRTPNQKNRKDIYDNYCGMFPSREIFEKVLDACTEDYGCLVVDNTSRSNKLEDQVFYYKASDHEPFKLCPKQFWQQKKPVPKRDENTKESKFILKKKNAKFVVRKN
jgi:hypothetical protein